MTFLFIVQLLLLYLFIMRYNADTNFLYKQGVLLALVSDRVTILVFMRHFMQTAGGLVNTQVYQ